MRAFALTACLLLAACIAPASPERLEIGEYEKVDGVWQTTALTPGKPLPSLRIGARYDTVGELVTAANLSGETIKVSATQEFGIRTVTITTGGYRDDSVAGERLVVEGKDEAGTMIVTGMKKFVQCYRGPTGWIPGLCP